MRSPRPGLLTPSWWVQAKDTYQVNGNLKVSGDSFSVTH